MTRGLRRPWSTATTRSGLVRGVLNQKIPQELKTKRPGSQIRADVAHLGEWDEGANRFLDLAKDAVGSTWTLGSDVFPNLG